MSSLIGFSDTNIHTTPCENFIFALKAIESRRQYPKRFEAFINSIGLEGNFEEKSFTFYKMAIKNP